MAYVCTSGRVAQRFDWSHISSFFISIMISPSFFFSFAILTIPFPSQKERSQPQTWIQTSDTHRHTHKHTHEERGLYCSCLLCRIQHKTTVSPKDPHTPDMKWCTKIKEENAVKKEGRRKRRRRAVVGTALAPVALSNCSLSLLSSSLFKKKKNQKNTRAPQSLGTAASQILVLNDVRNMAFWGVTAST